MIDLASIDLAQFANKWYGVPDQPANSATDCDHLPAPLHAWYDLAAKYSVSLLGVKRFVAPTDIKLRNGKMVFLTDPSDAIWGFDADDSKNVYEGRLYGDWAKIPESLSDFLVHNMIGEAVYNAPYAISCDSVQNVRIADIVAPMEEVAIGAWNWPDSGHRLFMGRDVVAEIGPAISDGAPMEDVSGRSEVQVGAVTPEAAAYLESMPGIDWC
ncbi:hypothetical protein ABT301_03290 [Streptomyces sp. NPDC000987]|uniref:hypothetical protein n=1 Tax=Streptomyces sp. NPDC000987 TaxID=3154374 RepID=UPI003324F63F